MKVVMLSENDYAGSGMRICQAVRKHSDIDIMLITFQRSRYGHSSDVCVIDEITNVQEPTTRKFCSINEKIRNKSMRSHIIKQQLSKLQDIIDSADIIHLKGDEPPKHFTDWHGYLSYPNDKPVIVTVGGSAFRRNSAHAITSRASWPMADYHKADLRTALTPDLNYKDYDGLYTQQVVPDVGDLKDIWQNREVPIIAHSPSMRSTKGTQVFLEACEKLAGKGYSFEVDIIEKVDYKTCLQRKSQATIFFDQLGNGFYGNAALEAMAMGIPTVCQISRQALRQSDGKLNNSNCPVINFRSNTAEACYRALKRVLDADLQKLSTSTVEFVNEFHSHETVAKMWQEIYKGL